ncbi:MAG: tetratricopeptide repeat protein [Magnetococcales bacterium]|nr:tetratricopeptide repeat protein [Magnetococcales bacterium]
MFVNHLQGSIGMERAFALYASGRAREALAIVEAVLATAAPEPAWWNLLAACHQELGDPVRAEWAYRQGLVLAPGDADLHYNLGLLLAGQPGREADAEAALGQATTLAPDLADAWLLLGNLSIRLRKDPVEAYRRAIDARPDDRNAHNNLGVALANAGRHDQAEAVYRRALEMQPEHVELRWNYSLLLLAAGRFGEGWPLHEARYHPHKLHPNAFAPDGAFPMWRGEEVAGRSLLVLPEQGFGDQLQFCRFLPCLRGLGVAEVTLVAPAPLLPLFATLAGVDRLLADNPQRRYPRHDYWVFLNSLPLRLGTTLETIPAVVPYLQPLPERLAAWRALLPGPEFRVGLVWRGNPANTNDHFRSLPGLATLAPLWGVPGVSFISLQKGHGEEEALHPPEGQPLRAFADRIVDFADAAALIARLDLVITVDSALAHLAGALAKPCWVMLTRYNTSWRWLQGRTDSPWYPRGMRLFRQSEPGDWAPVVEALRVELARMRAMHRFPVEDAHALYAANRPEEALDALAPLLEAGGGEAASLNLAAACHLRLERPGQAESLWRQALGSDPGHADIWNNLGVLLKRQRRYAESEAALREALRLAPDFHDAWINLRNLLHETGRGAACEEVYRAILRLAPGDCDSRYRLAVLLKQGNRPGEAEEEYRKLLAVCPDHAPAWNNLGNLLKAKPCHAEALAAYRQALRLDPDHPETRWNASLLLFLLGDLAPAWPLYEARYHDAKIDRRNKPLAAPFPMWRGEDPAGKSLLIIPEQGYGDQIQFCRYAAVLKAMGAVRLTLVCLPALRELFLSLPDVDQVLVATPHQETAWHDFWTFPLSIPLHVGTTLTSIPARLPYLSAAPERLERWRARLPATGGLRVGLLWQGSPQHPNDANRSLPGLAVLAPLWEVPGVGFVSLQKRSGEEEASHPPPGQPLFHAGAWIEDFADTAAILTLLDLVITIDSAVAHLAGALARPCWLMLPAANSDWRWLLEREDSPWYPGVMRLFRQAVPGDWSAVMQRMRGELAALAEAARLRGAYDRAVRLTGAGELAEAEGIYRAMLRERPDLADVHNNLACLLHGMGRHAEAAEAAQQAIDLQPGHMHAHYNRALALHEQGESAAALEAYCRTLEIAPGHADAWYNLAMLLQAGGRLAEAETALRRALALRPDHPGAGNNLGNLLKDQKRFGEAEAAFRQWHDRHPDCANARWNLALLLLMRGAFREGWPLYDARLHPDNAELSVRPPDLPFPMWRGEDLAGASLLILPEQGWGDLIQFCRYATLLRSLGASRITLVAHPVLVTLLASLEGVDQVVEEREDQAWPPHDFWVFPLSIPQHVQGCIPERMPYLHAPPERVRAWEPVFRESGFRVGLAWRGNPNHRQDAWRSLPGLATLAPLWRVSGVRFVSLQKGPGEEEAQNPPPEQPLLDAAPGLTDFAATAAVLAHLDLVITVDSALAHLAGALAKPCWVMLPDQGCDWRWMRERSDSPWYPGVLRLFRQTRPGDWTEVVEVLRGELASAVAGSACQRQK